MKTVMMWGVEMELPEPKPVKPMDVSAYSFMFANAVIYGADDAETIRANAEEFATHMQSFLIELSQDASPEVESLLDKYISKL